VTRLFLSWFSPASYYIYILASSFRIFSPCHALVLLSMFLQCHCCLINADPSLPPVAAAAAGPCKTCKTLCDCGSPWGECFADDGPVFIVSLTYCRFANSDGEAYRIRKQRCSNPDCSQIKTPFGLEHGLLNISSFLANVTCFYSVDLLYRCQSERMEGHSVTDVWRSISNAHKTLYFDYSLQPCNLSRHQLRRAMITFTNSQCLPSEASFSCFACGHNPQSVHFDG